MDYVYFEYALLEYAYFKHEAELTSGVETVETFARLERKRRALWDEATQCSAHSAVAERLDSGGE